MPVPRFTISQLLLTATLIALVIGLFTAADRLGPRDKVCQLCFSPSGKLIAARYQTGVVRVWQLEGKEPRLVTRCFGSPPLAPKGNQWLMEMEAIGFADDDRLIKLESHQLGRRVDVRELNVATGKVSEMMPLAIPFVQQWNVAINGDWVYAGHWGTGNVLCCNLKDRTASRTLTASADPLHAVQVSSDGRVLAAIDQEGMVSVVDLENDKVINRLPAAKSAYLVQALSPDGTKLITPAQPSIASEKLVQQIAVWDTASGEVEHWPTELTHGQVGIAPSRNARVLAVWDSYGGIEFHDMETMKLRQRLSREALLQASYLELSPDGATLAASSDDRVMQWDIATGKLLSTMGGGESRIAPIAIFTTGFALWAAVWGFHRRRDRKPPPAGRHVMQTRGKFFRRLLVGTACLVVTAIVIVELTMTGTVRWRDFRNSWSSLSELQVFSLFAVPVLVIALVRRLNGWRTPSAATTLLTPDSAAAPLSPPLALKICWWLMIAGGLIALLKPIGYLFLDRDAMLWTYYYGFFAGVLAISRGASRDTRSLRATVGVQAINVIALDPFNLLLAGVEQLLLRRARLKQYVQWANVNLS